MNFELLILGWLLALTVWLVFAKRGPQGARGVDGTNGDWDNYNNRIKSWDINDASLEMLDSSKYMTKLIQNINSYQLHSGNKLDK